MPLTPEQVVQFKRQLLYYKHPREIKDVRFSDGKVLEHFIVEENVHPVENFTSRYFGDFLARISPFMPEGMTVIDAFCGSGMQTMIVARYWNARVIAGDKWQRCVDNTLENARLYGLENRVTAVQSDVLSNIHEEADAIIANFNFAFDLTTEEYLQLREEDFQTAPRGEVIHRLLEQAKTRLKKDGTIFIPYFHFWGEINDPGVQAPKHGYKIGFPFRFESKTGVHRGPISIYLIKR